MDAAARRRGAETINHAGVNARPHGGGFQPLTRRASAADAVEQTQKSPSERPEPRPRSKFLGECVHGRQTRGPIVEPRVRVECETAGEKSVERGGSGARESVAVGNPGRRRAVFVFKRGPQFRQANAAADSVEGNFQGEQFVAEDAERKIVRPEIDRCLFQELFVGGVGGRNAVARFPPGGPFDRPRRAKIDQGEFRRPGFEDDVRRLDVAVDGVGVVVEMTKGRGIISARGGRFPRCSAAAVY